MFTFRDRSMYVPQLDLWIDSMRRRSRGYISHAHADHARPHDVIVGTAANAAICRARYSTGTSNFENHEFNESWREGDFELTLFSAGHVLGSAQLMIEGADGRYVYTGDFKMETAYTVIPTEVKKCDVVLMECTYGKPRYVFPPRAEIAGLMQEFARKHLERGIVPVFLAYSLGKAQETIAILGSAKIPVTVHSSVAEVSDVYREHGVALPPYQRYDATIFEGGSALIWPPSGAPLTRALRAFPMRRAGLTGWSLDGSGRYAGDCAFPLSDHADFPSLLRYIELAEPKKVLLHHGDKCFVKDLQKRGIHAEYFEQNAQLTLL